MSNKVKINGIQFNLDAVSKLESLEAFKAQGAAAHFSEAEANAIYNEAWRLAMEHKDKVVEPVLTVEHINEEA